MVNGSFVELAGRSIVTGEETFRSLELAWSADGLELHAKPPVGASVWGGGADQLTLNEADPVAIKAVDGRLDVFENWLD